MEFTSRYPSKRPVFSGKRKKSPQSHFLVSFHDATTGVTSMGLFIMMNGNLLLTTVRIGWGREMRVDFV